MMMLETLRIVKLRINQLLNSLIISIRITPSMTANSGTISAGADQAADIAKAASPGLSAVLPSTNRSARTAMNYISTTKPLN